MESPCLVIFFVPCCPQLEAVHGPDFSEDELMHAVLAWVEEQGGMGFDMDDDDSPGSSGGGGGGGGGPSSSSGDDGGGGVSGREAVGAGSGSAGAKAGKKKLSKPRA